MSQSTTLSLKELWERDERTCHLCSEPVSLRFATRDHVVPRSRGGSNARENIRLAHRWCNEARGSSLEGVPAHVIARVRVKRERAARRQSCICGHHKAQHVDARHRCMVGVCRCECYFSQATVETS